MKRVYGTTVALVVPLCVLVLCTISSAESAVKESAFCLDMAERECSTPVTGNEVTLSQAASTDNGFRRIYFRSKIAVGEDTHLLHIWTHKREGDRSSEQIHLAVSGKVKDLPPESRDGVVEHLKERYAADPLAHSVQGVLLSIKMSPGFRTYSRIKAKTGTYTVEVCDLKGNSIPGGEAKSIEVLP